MRRILPLLFLSVALAGWRDTSRKTVVLVPIGPVPADLLAQLQRELPPFENRDVAIAAEIPRPAAAFDAGRQQYRGGALLEELERRDIAGADRVVGLIDADVYAPGLNFIFGQAMKPGRFAVVALPRLRARPERVLKVTVHELGHSFGFAHCSDTNCVMRFANAVGDLDRQGFRYCALERRPR